MTIYAVRYFFCKPGTEGDGCLSVPIDKLIGEADMVVNVDDKMLRLEALRLIMTDESRIDMAQTHTVVADVGYSKSHGGLGASHPYETVILLRPAVHKRRGGGPRRALLDNAGKAWPLGLFGPPGIVPTTTEIEANFKNVLAYLGFDFDVLYYSLHKGNPALERGVCNSKKSFLELLEEFSHTIAPGEHPYTRQFAGDGFLGKRLPVGCKCLFLDCATFVVFYTMAKRLLEDPCATVAGLKLPLKYSPITEKEPSNITIMKEIFDPYNPICWYPDRDIICLARGARADGAHSHNWMAPVGDGAYIALTELGIIQRRLPAWVDYWGKGTVIGRI